MSNLLLKFCLSLHQTPKEKNKKKPQTTETTKIIKPVSSLSKRGTFRFVIIQRLKAFTDKRVEKALLLFPW